MNNIENDVLHQIGMNDKMIREYFIEAHQIEVKNIERHTKNGLLKWGMIDICIESDHGLIILLSSIEAFFLQIGYEVCAEIRLKELATAIWIFNNKKRK